jgi:hypothetical protein
VVKRTLLLLLAAVPGVALALGAKPFVLGESALLFGLFLAFALPAAVVLVQGARSPVEPLKKDDLGLPVQPEPKGGCFVALLCLAALAAPAYFYVRARPLVFGIPTHAHCIKYAGLSLVQYADAHGERFPYSLKGYPDAILQLDPDCYNSMTGPGYSPEVLRQAKKDGTPLTEADCGRVYVQGLKQMLNHQRVILFDKLPTPGGDHCRGLARLWAPLGREVCYTNGSMAFIRETDWPLFARQQVELLVRDGFDRVEAERLYAPSAQ